tara:strand:- start:1735 stop:2145 length:411 start_codon:yes stop_codon:yes gene_type:complete
MAGKAAKKSAPKKAPKATKATLVKKLQTAGLTVPEGADVAEMEYRLKWFTDLDTAGYNVSLFRGWGSQFDDHPLSLLNERKIMYWLPPSELAEKIVQTKLVKVVKRGLPLNNATVIVIPEDYKERFGNGGNDSADS